MKREPLKITFHDPNTKEETIDYLTKLLAQNLVEQALEKTV